MSTFPIKERSGLSVCLSGVRNYDYDFTMVFLGMINSGEIMNKTAFLAIKPFTKLIVQEDEHTG